MAGRRRKELISRQRRCRRELFEELGGSTQEVRIDS
jgi:hypothetical protein